MQSPLWRHLLVVVCLLAATSVAAEAQVCGDADGNGSVTVTDGVQALRAAANLSSTCGTLCDIDGSGGITVTDGVNVLRKAAALPVTENCGGVSTQVESLLQSSLSVFGSLVKFGGAAGVASATPAGSFECDNFDGEFFFDDSTGEIFFSNCELDGFLYEGSLGVGGNALVLDIVLTDLTTGEVQGLSGSLSERQDGGAFVIDGFFDFSSSVLGTFSVEFNSLVSDPNSFFFTGGSLFFTVDDANLPEVEGIEITFNTTNVALVEVVLLDQEIIPFDYDLVSGELTPISN